MKSKLELAQQFQDWVFEHVLPSIRKIGQEKYIKELEEKHSLQVNEEKKQYQAQLNRLHDFNQELTSYLQTTLNQGRNHLHCINISVCSSGYIQGRSNQDHAIQE